VKTKNILKNTLMTLIVVIVSIYIFGYWCQREYMSSLIFGAMYRPSNDFLFFANIGLESIYTSMKTIDFLVATSVLIVILCIALYSSKFSKKLSSLFCVASIFVFFYFIAASAVHVKAESIKGLLSLKKQTTITVDKNY